MNIETVSCSSIFLFCNVVAPQRSWSDDEGTYELLFFTNELLVVALHFIFLSQCNVRALLLVFTNIHKLFPVDRCIFPK
jgi:membrane-anchored protein YejM (alkaline phosphatase superfamily)